jgi:hypothetical protein
MEKRFGNSLRVVAIITLSTFIISGQCQKVDDTGNLSECRSEQFVKSVTEEEGTIWLNKSLNKYALYTGVRGTYDSQIVGVICNIPTEYKKDGLTVIVSGDYFEYNKDASQKFPGQTYFFLELREIKKKTIN